jgi:UPF0755 protein
MEKMEPRPRSFKLGIILVLLTVGASIPGIKLLRFALSPLRPGDQQSTYVVVTKGLNPKELSRILTSQQMIQDADSFIWLGKITRQWKHIKAGEYKISPSMSPIEIFSTLTSGISAAHPITVREGENFYEIANDLEAKGLASAEHFVRLCKDPQFIASLGIFKEKLPPTLEGYFFPDTYFFNRTLTDSDMIKQMVRHFLVFWTPQIDARAKLLQMTQHEVLTLASIIEKETGVPDERPIISSVFHNRLKKRMKLQSDPTTIYGMWERYEGKIHRSDLLEKNSYNTYSVKALPIGPIGNPGKEAIEAALNPANTNYFYFVSHNDGTHQFSTTIEEHNQAVRRFQIDPKAREGKSWRDYLRKTSNTKN